MRITDVGFLAAVAGVGLLAVAGQGAETIEGEIVGLLPRQKALAVHVGAKSAAFATAFGGASNLVHGVEPDAAAAQQAMAEVFKQGLSGRVWIEVGSVRVLPYVNSLANVVFVDDWSRMKEAGLTAAEVVRVLAPDGVGCVGQRVGTGPEATEDALRQWMEKTDVKDARAVKREGVWLVFRKARPAGLDEWTHELHDSTRNPATQDTVAGVPQQIHWIGGMPYTWQIEHYRTAGKRVLMFYAGRRGLSRWGTFKADTERIEALDAFSGVHLWTRDYPAPAKGFFPIVVGDRIVAQVGEELCALDAASGEPVLVYTNAAIPYAGVVLGDTLFAVKDEWVKAVDLRTGAARWEAKPEQGSVWTNKEQASGWLFYNPMAAENMVLMLELYRKKGEAKSSERVVGLDVKTGERVWTFDDPVIAGHHKRCFYHEGRLFFSTPTGFVSVPIAKDKAMWKVPLTPFEARRFAAPWNTFGTRGLFWVRESPGGRGFAVGEKADLAKPMAPKTWVGMDPETGKVVKRIGYEPGISGWRGRCYADLAGPNFIYSENGEFVDLVNEKISNYRIFRGHCGWGPLFGNGFFYGTPTWCIFCYPALHGAIAAGPVSPPATPVADDERLEKGPAYGELGTRNSELGTQDAEQRTGDAEIRNPQSAIRNQEWPMYRQNAARTSGTTAPVAMPLASEPVWKQAFGERITGTAIADGRVYLAAVNQGRICALDEKTGNLVWSVSAGPRVDSPPTWYRGLLLFGSHDGYVYALRASDGALAWRFRAAQERRLMVCGDRVESAWPLPGAVLVHEGALYCLAGRITGADGGMHMYALDPLTGKMKWHRVVGRTTNPKLATGGDPKLYYWIEPEGQLSNNHLLGSGKTIRLPDQHFVWDFRAEDGEQIVPDKVQGVYLSTFNSQWPWMGYDRPTWSYTFHGFDIHAEYRHPYESGTMMAYATTNSVGIVCKRLRKEQVTELIATKVDDAAKNWEPKTQGEMPWKPIRIPMDVHGLIVAGDTAFLAGMDFALRPEKGRVLAMAMKDGTETQRIELPALPTYDGLAAANGRMYVSMQDGTLWCLGKKP
jgi:outer membrane protein assembly factor BamB